MTTGAELVPALTSFGGVPVGAIRDRPQFMKALIYGKPGVGKTTLVSQAARIEGMAPVLFMTPDQAEADTLRKVAPEAQVAFIRRFSQFDAIYKAAAKLAADGKPIPFKTFICDTGTEAQKLSMNDIMAQLLITGRPGGGEVNFDVPAQREWGESISQMRTLVRHFRDLPVNFLMTCHEAEAKDNRGITWIVPDLPGKLKNQTCGMFSNVFYMDVMQKKEPEGKKKIVTDETRLLLTGLTEGYQAKSRTGLFQRVIEDPKLEDLYKAIISVAEEPSVDREAFTNEFSGRVQ
jgi:hypothetical protein